MDIQPFDLPAIKPDRAYCAASILAMWICVVHLWQASR